MDTSGRKMTVTEAIHSRRSIRKFKPDIITREQIETLIDAACAAPSSKNSQPWKFVVIMDETEKERVLDAMEQGIERFDRDNDFELKSKMLSGARHSLSIMKKAPVNIFVFAPNLRHIGESRTPYDTLDDLVSAQSIGAAIQNMLLTATEMGLGSLWICDIYFAYEELVSCLEQDGLMIAAVSIGVADESPGKRPRKSMEEVTEWR